MTTKEILIAAADHLNRVGWCRVDMYAGIFEFMNTGLHQFKPIRNGRSVIFEEYESLARCCMLGAVRVVSPTNECYEFACERIRDFIRPGVHSIGYFNDHIISSQEEAVQTLLRAAG